MRPSTPPTAARRKLRRVATVAAPLPDEIPEDAFHLARASATALTNTIGGESFATPGATYVRVNDRHFRITGDAPLAHGEALTLLGRSSIWRMGGGR